MGGFGSGRPRTRGVIEDALTLDIGHLVRESTIKPGYRSGALAWRSGSTDAEYATLEFFASMNADSGSGDLRLLYQVTDPWDATQHVVDERIELEGLPQPYGGHLWYFRCPTSGRRCRKLYKPPGARRFASRQAYRLKYDSQRKAPYERAIAQAQKIRSRIGASLGIGEPVYRPCWMHETTFKRHLDRLERYEDVVEGQLMKALLAVGAKEV